MNSASMVLGGSPSGRRIFRYTVCPLNRWPEPGITFSVVIPPETTRRNPESRGLIESYTRTPGWIGPVLSAAPMPPTWLCVSTRPGMMTFPITSCTVAPAGTATEPSAPTAAIFPSRTTRTPRSISEPLIGMTRAPTYACVSEGAWPAEAGATNNATAAPRHAGEQRREPVFMR